MASDKTPCPLDIATPANYRILVQGTIDQSWSNSLSGMRITVCDAKQSCAVTTLEGLLQDQAELLGVLNALYDSHRPIISVELMTAVDL